MSRNGAQSLIIRSPSGRSNRVSVGSKFSVIEFGSSADTVGQWMIYPEHGGPSRYLGISNGTFMERIANTLVFSSGLDDVGEQFCIVIFNGAVETICIRLSPKKCPTSQHHQYVDSYSRMFEVPTPGASSVAGVSDPAGRLATIEELGFQLINDVADLLRCCSALRGDLQNHERRLGAVAGVDALKTIAAWRQNRGWYRVGTDRDTNGFVTVEAQRIVPLKTSPRETSGKNLFLGACSEALRDLANFSLRTPAGSVVKSLLLACKSRLGTFDLLAECSVREAWRILESGRYPIASQRFATALCKIRTVLLTDSSVTNKVAGVQPLTLFEPELIFQQFAVGEILSAFGVPLAAVAQAYFDSRSEAGFVFDDLVAWSDVGFHRLAGWRDGTSLPSIFRPDLVLANPGQSKALLIDAKFRGASVEGGILSGSGVKELQAYLNEFRLTRAVMVLPSPNDQLLIEDLQGDGNWIRGIAIPPNISPEQRNRILEALNKMWNNNLHWRDTTIGFTEELTKGRATESS